MNQTIKLIEHQLDKLNISKKDLANELGLSRGGLYTMLSNFDNIKLSSLKKLCEVIKIDMNDLLLIHNFNPAYAFNQILFASNKLKINEFELAGYLGTSIEKTSEFKENKIIEYEYTERFSRHTGIPFEYFLSSRNTDEVNLEEFITNQDLFQRNDLLKRYFEHLSTLQVKFCNLINAHVENNKVKQQKDIFYIQEAGLELSGSIASIHVSILMEGNKKPIVMISNLPTDRFFIEHFIEDIFSKIKDQFLNNYKCREIVWIYSTYISKKIEDRITNIVKFEKDFSKPEFFELYNHMNRNSELDKNKLQQFLK